MVEKMSLDAEWESEEQDAAWILFNMSLQHAEEEDAVENTQYTFFDFPKKKRSIREAKKPNPKWVFPSSNWVAHSSCGKMKLKIIFSGCDSSSSSSIQCRPKSLLGSKRCLPVQEGCGDGGICKKPRTSGYGSPELPQGVKDKILSMGGSETRFMIQKPLHSSDTNHGQARLQIPKKQVANEFLSQQEEAVLDKSKQGIRVLLIQPSDNVSSHCLKKRKMGKSIMYQITDKWNGVVDNNANGLTMGVSVQLWSFRIQTCLCFAITTL